MDIETALNEIGSFGPWHLWIFSWIFFMTLFTSAVNVAIVFLIDIPDFACLDSLPARSRENLTFDEIRKNNCPLDQYRTPDCCKTYKHNGGNVSNFVNEKFYNSWVNSTPVEECNGPWIWNYTGMQNSAVTQWSLICDRSMQVAHMQFVYMLGYFVACFSFGFLADKFGRRNVAAVSFTIAGVIGVIHSLIPNFYIFLLVRFLLGVFASGGKQCSYVLAMEFCNQKFRKVMGTIFFISYSAGYVLLAAIAYLVKDWRIMHVVISAPLCLGILLFWTIPESPRWLLTKKRFGDLRKLLQWAAKWNQREVSSLQQMQVSEAKENLLNLNQPTVNGTLVATYGQEQKQLTFLEIFCHLKLTLRALNIFFNWFVNAFVYYGISLLITSFSGNIFVNNAISGALETPAYLLCYPLLFWARKKSLMILLILSGISGLLYLALPTDWQTIQLLLAFVGKLCITASFNMVYIVTVELYPTPIRGASLLVSSMVGRVGSIVAPYAALIAQTNKSLMAVPMVIFGGSALLAGFLTVFIPESQGQPLPESLNDILHYPPGKQTPTTTST